MDAADELYVLKLTEVAIKPIVDFRSLSEFGLSGMSRTDSDRRLSWRCVKRAEMGMGVRELDDWRHALVGFLKSMIWSREPLKLVCAML